MNGIRYFLDTNAIIALLKGNKTLESALLEADWIGTSVITVIEFLSFKGLTENDLNLFRTFVGRIHVAGLPSELDESLFSIAFIRLRHQLKLPDAIIVAQSKESNALLLTNDKQLKEFGTTF